MCQSIASFFFFLIFIYLFIYFWLCWVFVSVQGLSLVVASGGHSSSRYAGLSLRSTGSRRASSVAVAHGPSCSAACGIVPGQGSNLCPLHWQADSQPLRHQGSPYFSVFSSTWLLFHLDMLHLLNVSFKLWSWELNVVMHIQYNYFTIQWKSCALSHSRHHFLSWHQLILAISSHCWAFTYTPSGLFLMYCLVVSSYFMPR